MLSKDKEITSRKKAKNTVYRLLKYRLRSEKEISDKLKTKKIPDDLITEIIDHFKKLHLIDDRQFSQAWIQARLSKPYGFNRIRYELMNKGIQPQILQDELTLASANFEESKIVLDLAKKRAMKYKNIEHVKMKQRVYGYLIRRGFHPDYIRKAIAQL